MARTLTDEPVDDRLLTLLAVERRLQDRIRNAEADAIRRIADARAEGVRVRADAEQTLQRADRDQARADADAHARALASIQHEHEEVLRRFADAPETRIEELANLAIDRVFNGGGGAA